MSIDLREISKPLGLINPTNQSGLLLILTALSLCFVLFALGLRLYIRLLLQKSWKWDDTASSIASVSHPTACSFWFINFSPTFRLSSLCRRGLYSRKSFLVLGPRALQKIFQKSTEHCSRYLFCESLTVCATIELTWPKLHFANNILYVLTLVPIKLSVCLLFLRITLRRRHVFAIWTIMAICTTCGLASVLLVCIGIAMSGTQHIPVSWWGMLPSSEIFNLMILVSALCADKFTVRTLACGWNL